jgi:excinuclease ABC subunit A
MLLAPVVSARKGNTSTCWRTQCPGLRARAHRRRVCTSSTTAGPGRCKKKHDIEVVVDRFRVRGDLQLRLAESIETALELSGGILRVAAMDEPEANRRPSPPASPAQSAATASRSWSRGCSRSTTRQAPAQPATGSASSSSSTRTRWSQPELSLATGAMRGWDRRNGYYFQMLRALAEHDGFDLETPWQALPSRIRDWCCTAAAVDKFKLKLPHERGSGKLRGFEGILGNMQRRYRETDSPPCARSSRATSPPAPARPATARG